jgi:hypothetical protein
VIVWLVLVRAVLTASSIFHLIVLDLPKWAIKAIDEASCGKVKNRQMEVTVFCPGQEFSSL